MQANDEGGFALHSLLLLSMTVAYSTHRSIRANMSDEACCLEDESAVYGPVTSNHDPGGSTGVLSYFNCKQHLPSRKTLPRENLFYTLL